LRESVGTNSHGNREHCGHGDRDATNEQHQQVVDSSSVVALLDGVHDNDFDNNAYCN
jgi:hypothetical protein